LPAPEGEDSTSIRPRRWIFSFDILGLLTKLIDHRLEGKPGTGERNVGGLGAKRVGFAVEFLRQEIQLAPHAFCLSQKRPRVLDMGGEPVQFLAHISLYRKKRHLL